MTREVKQIQKWFKSHVKDDGKPYTLDAHQAAIILDTHKNTLVTARAGSGKTRTIVAKIVYLIAHEQVKPESIIVFAFNRKARAEINERLTKIFVDDKPLFTTIPDLATTFHAFAYNTLGGKSVIGNNIITEAHENRLIAKIVEKLVPAGTKKESLTKYQQEAKQFITRAEQQYFKDYSKLDAKIEREEDENLKNSLRNLNKTLKIYKNYLKKHHLLNFNQMMSLAAEKIDQSFDYIFVDEYQDFSLLFLNLIQNLLKNSQGAHLLAVGDDWQAINRFAGGDVEYFKHFEHYFSEDSVKLFIPTNYRSGKKIVENANFFMSQSLKDFNGCKSGNKLKANIYTESVSDIKIPLSQISDLPLTLEQYFLAIARIVRENPDKTIKILHRNNDLSFEDWSLEKFCDRLNLFLESQNLSGKNISFSTIHRSKGLESDIVILLEIDAKKFPGPDRTGGLYRIFGDTAETLFEDEARLFYVALTRPKEKLYILAKKAKPNKLDQKYNFFNFLSPDFLEPLF